MTDSIQQYHKLFKAIAFAADRHKDQRRKGKGKIPYINHPLNVAKLLSDFGEDDVDLLIAAVLHDVIEDTTKGVDDVKKLSNEILFEFGEDVLLTVLEVTDNKELNVYDRKAVQLRITGQLSAKSKKLRVADKMCNVRDIAKDPPRGWSKRRKLSYLEWARDVVNKAHGENIKLDAAFDKVWNEVYESLK